MSPSRLATRLRNLFRGRPRALVLGYHRIADVQIDPSDITVSPERFLTHLELLASFGSVVPLADAVDGWMAGDRPALAITFDDGYRDNVTVAAPALSDAGMQATMFVPTCAVDREEDFWWDRLEAMVFHAPQLPDEVRLDLGRHTIEWKSPSPPSYIHDLDGSFRRWCVWRDPAGTPRQRLYRDLWDALRPLDRPDREAAMAALAGPLPWSTDLHPTVSTTDLRSAADGGTLEVGGHGRTHSLLAGRSADRQMEELVGGAEEIGGRAGTEVRAVSYPYGSFDRTSLDVLRDSPIRVACTTRRSPVRASGDRHAVPRLMVRDWTAEQLAVQLERLLGR